MAEEKTGQNIMKSVVLVMGVIILVLVSALIIGSLIGSSAFQTTLSGTITSETLTTVNDTVNKTFSIVSTYPNAACSLSALVNSTGGEAVAAANYTFYPTVCNLILAAGSEYIGGDLNATYGYTSVQNSIAGVNTTWLGAQFGLFVTALLGFLAVIGVIIAIVWLIGYIKPLFSKEDGIQTFGGN